MTSQIDRCRGALIGLAAGDAVGTTLEFRGRGAFEPIRDMIGGGPFGLKQGSGPTIRRWRSVWPRAWSGEPYSGSTDPMAAGNGCIMRLAPVPIYYYPDVDRAVHFAGESSRTTHGAAECVDACRLRGSMIGYVEHGGICREKRVRS